MIYEGEIYTEFTCYYKNRRFRERKAKVLFLFDRQTKKYAFVNVSKGHVCECRFNSLSDGIKDLKIRVEDPKNDLYKYKMKFKESISVRKRFFFF